MEVHVLSNWIKQQEWKKTQLNLAKNRKLSNKNYNTAKDRTEFEEQASWNEEHEKETKLENRKLMEMEGEVSDHAT